LHFARNRGRSRASFKKARLVRDAEFLYNEWRRFNLNFGSDKGAISTPAIIAVELPLKRGSSQLRAHALRRFPRYFPVRSSTPARKLHAHTVEYTHVYLCEHIYQARNTTRKTPPLHVHLRRMSLLYSYSRDAPVHG